MFLVAAPGFRPLGAAAPELRVLAACRLRVERIGGSAHPGAVDAELLRELFQRVAVREPTRPLRAGRFGGERIALEVLAVEDEEAGEVGVGVRRRIEAPQ